MKICLAMVIILYSSIYNSSPGQSTQVVMDKYFSAIGGRDIWSTIKTMYIIRTTNSYSNKQILQEVEYNFNQAILNNSNKLTSARISNDTLYFSLPSKRARYYSSVNGVHFKLSLSRHCVVEGFDLLSNQLPSLAHKAST